MNDDQKKEWVGYDALQLLGAVAADLRKILTGSEMSVLRAHVNEIRDTKTMLCWISQERVADHTCFATTTIRLAIQELEEKHLMTFERYLQRGIKEYRVTLPGAPAQEATPTTTKKKPASASGPKATPKATAASGLDGDDFE